MPISWLTLQNEPLHEPFSYPGMTMSAADQRLLIGSYLAPRLAASGLATRVLVYDHNWDNTSYPAEVLTDPAVGAIADGAAFHCYAGSPSAQSTFHSQSPTMQVWMSECSGGSWATNFGDNLMWNARNLVIGSPQAWASSILLWNLALDENGNPHTGGCVGCRGVVTVRSSDGAVIAEVERDVLAHHSLAVRSGARRLGVSGSLAPDSVAYRNPDGSHAVVMMNDTWSSKPATVTVAGVSATTEIPARGIVTLRWVSS